MSQALNLSKGKTVLNLRKKSGGVLTRVLVELLWDTDGPRKPYDLDASALTANADLSNPADFGKATSINDVCFYNQPQTTNIKHMKGDNRNGENTAAEGPNAPDEVMEINLAGCVGANTIPVFITINDENNLGQTFDEVTAPRARLVDAETGDVLVTADLTGLQPGSTAAIFVVFKKQADGAWSFENVSQGFPGKDLSDFLGLYGIATEYN